MDEKYSPIFKDQPVQINKPVSLYLGPESHPHGLCFDQNGELFISNFKSHRILKPLPYDNDKFVDFAGSTKKIWSQSPHENLQFVDASKLELQTPLGICSDPDYHLLVADSHANKILKISEDGVIEPLHGANNELLEQNGIKLNCPHSVCTSPHGELFITNTFDNSVIIHNLNNDNIVRISTFQNYDNKTEQMTKPWELCFSPKGVCYVSLASLNKIICITKSYEKEDANSVVKYTASWVCGTDVGLLDGNLKDAKFNQPTGIACGPDGKIFVADSRSKTIRVIDIENRQVSSLHRTRVLNLSLSPCFDLVFSDPTSIYLYWFSDLYRMAPIDHAPVETCELFEIYELNFGFAKRQAFNKQILSIIAPNLMDKPTQALIGELIQEQSLDLIFGVLSGRQVLQNPSQNIDFSMLLIILDAYLVFSLSKNRKLRLYIRQVLLQALNSIKTIAQLVEFSSKVASFTARLPPSNDFDQSDLKNSLSKIIVADRRFTYDDMNSICHQNESDQILRSILDVLAPLHFREMVAQEQKSSQKQATLAREWNVIDLSSHEISPQSPPAFSAHPIAATFAQHFEVYQLLHGNNAPNFQIIVGDRIFERHDWYLASRWPFFHKALLFKGIEWETKSLTIKPSKLSPESVSVLLDYLYYHTTSDLTEEIAVNILQNGGTFGVFSSTRALPGFEVLVYNCIEKVKSRQFRKYLPLNVIELKQSCFHTQMKKYH